MTAEENSRAGQYTGVIRNEHIAQGCAILRSVVSTHFDVFANSKAYFEQSKIILYKRSPESHLLLYADAVACSG